MFIDLHIVDMRIFIANSGSPGLGPAHELLACYLQRPIRPRLHKQYDAAKRHGIDDLGN